jgi:phosphatidylglycerophosphate synthase
VTIRTATVTTPASRGPLLGLAVQFVLLTALAGTVGLSAGGWLAGAAYAVVLWFFLSTGLRKARMAALGPANTVTLGRAVLVGTVTALVVTSLTRPVPLTLLVTVVGVALALDGVDGQVARRTGSTSALGARFDMEIDAFLILVLSVFVAGEFGWWTVAMGAFRYAFVAASWAYPWLTAALPPKFSRKVVAAVQGIVLVVATAHLLPPTVALAALALALGSLTWSFGRDIGWLWRTERARHATVVVPVWAALPALPIVPAIPRQPTFLTRPLRRTPAPVS